MAVHDVHLLSPVLADEGSPALQSGTFWKYRTPGAATTASATTSSQSSRRTRNL